MAHTIEKGSAIAKKGFEMERWVAETFSKWETEELPRMWLMSMDYDIEEIVEVKAEALKVKDCKSDVVVEVRIKLRQCADVQNIQVKLVSSARGFNQIDKRFLKNYKEKLWNDMPDNVYRLLQYFTGEIPPYKDNVRDGRRMFIDEFTDKEQNIILSWFKEKKHLIISDVIRGRGKLAAEWIMVLQIIGDRLENWCVANVNLVVDYMSEGDVHISPRGSLCIGRITMQRKGGDGGRVSARCLQFKEDPMDILDRFKNV